MSAEHGRRRARVSIETRALWRIRLAREVPRYLLSAAALAGLAVSVRSVLLPSRPASAANVSTAGTPTDPGAEGFAVLFARRYLSWSASEPQASIDTLAPYGGTGVEPAAGLSLPATGEQRVEWAEVVQAREPAPGRHVYTVAADTDSAGLLYLSVDVVRSPAGDVALADYPAFVGAPATAGADVTARLRDVTDGALQAVVRRALRNYLAAEGGELAADLAAGARVSVPRLALALESISTLTWVGGSQSVLAVALARDERGVRYTLAYEMDVVRAQGRWEISAIQMDPNA